MFQIKPVVQIFLVKFLVSIFMTRLDIHNIYIYIYMCVCVRVCGSYALTLISEMNIK